MAEDEEIDLEDHLEARDHKEFESISYNFAKADNLPEYGRGKVLNRYGDILPHPNTRVKLSIQGGNPASEYINANYIRNFGSETAGYIGAQGPTARTLPHFIRMCWEQNCKAIVMLTRLKEGPKAKCEPYFPARLDAPMVFDDIVVTLLSSSQKDGHIKNMLQLHHQVTGEKKKVVQFWYTSWPDHGVPEDKDGKPLTKDMILLVLTVRSFRKKADKFASPAIVHCSAGVGRTGAFIAIDQAITAFKQKKKIDINAMVRRMRKDRMALIQHTNQYKFVWAAVADYVVGKLQQNRTRNPRVSVHGVSPIKTAVDEWYISTARLENPDDNDNVMVAEVGTRLKLMEKADAWWWMSLEDGTEGWAAADLLVLEGSALTKVGNRVSNPFAPGVRVDVVNKATAPATIAATKETLSSVNPFEVEDDTTTIAVSHTGTQSNPFDSPEEQARNLADTYNPNPFQDEDEAIATFDVDASANNNTANPFLYDQPAEDHEEETTSAYLVEPPAENQFNPFFTPATTTPPPTTTTPTPTPPTTTTTTPPLTSTSPTSTATSTPPPGTPTTTTVDGASDVVTSINNNDDNTDNNDDDNNHTDDVDNVEPTNNKIHPFVVAPAEVNPFATSTAMTATTTTKSTTHSSSPSPAPMTTTTPTAEHDTSVADSPKPPLEHSMSDMDLLLGQGLDFLNERIAKLKTNDKTTTNDGDADNQDQDQDDDEHQDKHEVEHEEEDKHEVEREEEDKVEHDYDNEVEPPDGFEQEEEEEEDEELPPPPEVEVEAQIVVLTPTSDPSTAFYSSLQPWTYVTDEGEVKQLFSQFNGSTIASSLTSERVRSPQQIVGPAIVSHDGSWRMLDNADLFAVEKATTQAESSAC